MKSPCPQPPRPPRQGLSSLRPCRGNAAHRRVLTATLLDGKVEPRSPVRWEGGFSGSAGWKVQGLAWGGAGWGGCPFLLCAPGRL